MKSEGIIEIYCRNTAIMRMEEVQAFFNKQIQSSNEVKDYNEFDNFNLDE